MHCAHGRFCSSHPKASVQKVFFQKMAKLINRHEKRTETHISRRTLKAIHRPLLRRRKQTPYQSLCSKDGRDKLHDGTDGRCPRKRIRPEHMRAHSAYQPKSRMQTTQSGTGGDDPLPHRLYKEQALYQSDARTSPRHVFGRMRQS